MYMRKRESLLVPSLLSPPIHFSSHCFPVSIFIDSSGKKNVNVGVISILVLCKAGEQTLRGESVETEEEGLGLNPRVSSFTTCSAPPVPPGWFPLSLRPWDHSLEGNHPNTLAMSPALSVCSSLWHLTLLTTYFPWNSILLWPCSIILP